MKESCERFREVLSDLAAGGGQSLPPGLVDHPSGCDACRTELLLAQRIEEGLGSLPAPDGERTRSLDWGLLAHHPAGDFDPTRPIDLSVGCEEFGSLLDGLIDGRVDREYAAELTAHAGACAPCARLLAVSRRIESGLAALPVFDPPSAIRERVASRIDALPLARTAGWRAALARLMRSPVRVLVPALAIGIVIAVSLVGLPKKPLEVDEEVASSTTSVGGTLETAMYSRSVAVQWDYVEDSFKAYAGRLAARKAEGR